MMEVSHIGGLVVGMILAASEYTLSNGTIVKLRNSGSVPNVFDTSRIACRPALTLCTNPQNLELKRKEENPKIAL